MTIEIKLEKVYRKNLMLWVEYSKLGEPLFSWAQSTELGKPVFSPVESTELGISMPS